MKIRRLIVIAGLLVAVAVFISVALISHWQHSQTFKYLPKVVLAAQTYSQDRIAHGQTLPASVSLRDLVASKYVSAEDVREFDGMDVTVYPTTNDADPQSILVRVRMPDGTQIAAMGDGSIQALPR
jgi:Flp pilus assembly protein CpaB